MNAQTQSERFAIKLVELSRDVTKKDRQEARRKLKLTGETISRYLNGNHKVMDNDTAVKIIEFFKDRIDKREQIIQD